jgi:proteasome accessory factor C
MPKLTGGSSLSGEDRFNLMLSLVGFLQKRGTVSLEEAAQHFEIDKKYLRKLVSSINDARAEVRGFEHWFFLIDIDELEENENLALTENLVIETSPKLSNRQASAIAAGLNYLAAMPHFKDDADLKVLQNLLADGTHRGLNPLLEVRPGSAQAGAEQVREAIVSGVAISCEYINQKGERSVRKLEPLRLDPRPEGWYVRAFCPLNDGVRNFKLDRMRAIVLLDESISEAAKSIHSIEDSVYLSASTDTTVLVEVDPEAYRLVSEFVAVTEPSSPGDGKIRAEIKVGHLPNIGKLVARFGGAARVISPPEARKQVLNFALKALGRVPEPSASQMKLEDD